MGQSHEPVTGATTAVPDGPASVVPLVWCRLAAYDQAAQRLRRQQSRLQVLILTLGVVVTGLAILQNQLGDEGDGRWWDDALRASLVVLPVLTSVLIATAASLAPGRRWVQLRSAAESIRREIFTWRTRTGPYAADAVAAGQTDVEVLISRVEEIEIRLVHSDAGSTTLPVIAPADAVARAGGDPSDDGVSVLGADGYFRLRIDDQLDYYRNRAGRLRRRVNGYRGAAVLAGAAGTVLAVTGFEVWIGVSTAVGAAIAAHMGRAQLETTLAAYNEAIASLETLRTRWAAVPAGGHTATDLADLVSRAEKVFEVEQSTWARHLSDAVDTPFAS